MKVVAQLTDLHMDDFLAKKYRIDTRKNVEATLQNLEKRGIQDVVLTGDLGEPSSLPWLQESIGSRGMRPSIVLGNHDKASAFHGFNGIGELIRKDGLYYAKPIEGIRCLFLDSSSAVIGRDQLKWIAEEIQKVEASALAVFLHHPILDCGRTLMDRRYPLKNREALAELLGGFKFEVSVFCGHYHMRHEQRQGKITQYVTPSLFVQFKSQAETFQIEDKAIAYRIIEFNSGRLRTELVDVR